MKKLVFLILSSVLFSFTAFGQTNKQSTGDKITETSKKVAKTTVKGVGKGINVGKNTVVKGAKATVSGVKKIFS